MKIGRWLILIALIGFDQWTKSLAQEYLPLGKVHPQPPNGIWSLTHVHNTGGAFSMLSGYRWFFVAVALVATVVLLYWIRKERPCWSNWTLWAYLLFCGGAIGNLIDRIFLGYVVDFIDFYFWPVFNFADIFLCLGVGLFFVLAFFSTEESDESP